MGTLMESMLAAIAQFDNDIRTIRTTAGLKARTEQGGWPHDAPFGYKKSRTASGITTITPDPDNADKIIKLFDEFETGNYNVKQASDLAFNLGITNRRGEKRSWESIKKLLSNPLYAGLIKSKFTNGNEIRGLHRPLITERTYHQSLNIIRGNNKNYNNNYSLDWPLRGGFLIHHCGKPLTGSSPRGRNGPSPRYSCPVCRYKPGKATSKRRELVHKEFVELLNTIRPDEPSKKLFKEIVLRRWNQEYKNAIQHNANIDNEIEHYKARKSRVIDLYIDSKLNEDEKKAKLTEIEQAVAHLQLQRIEGDSYIQDKESIIDSALLCMSEPGKFWNLGDNKVKRRVQHAIFPEGLNYDFEEGFGTAKLSTPYLFIKEISDNPGKNPSVVAASGLEPLTSGL